jgi:hypothetical protein
VVEVEEEIADAVADVEEEEVPTMGMGREGAQGSDTKLYYESQMCLHYREGGYILRIHRVGSDPSGTTSTSLY